MMLFRRAATPADADAPLTYVFRADVVTTPPPAFYHSVRYHVRAKFFFDAARRCRRPFCFCRAIYAPFRFSSAASAFTQPPFTSMPVLRCSRRVRLRAAKVRAACCRMRVCRRAAAAGRRVRLLRDVAARATMRRHAPLSRRRAAARRYALLDIFMFDASADAFQITRFRDARSAMMLFFAFRD